MAANRQVEYTDYARVKCEPNFKIGSEVNLFAAMFCDNCKCESKQILRMLNDEEAAKRYIQWGGDINKKKDRKNKTKVKDTPHIKKALSDGIKPDNRFFPGVTLTIGDLRSLFEEDKNDFLIRSAFYQPNHLFLIKKEDPDLWQKILELCTKYGVIQNIPLDDITLAYIRNHTDKMFLQTTQFVEKVKKYRAAGLITEKSCKGLITVDPTILLSEMVIHPSRPYIKAIFGRDTDEETMRVFSIFSKEDTMINFMKKIHEVRAIPMFEKIPEDFLLDEDHSWKNYPLFEVYMFVDTDRKTVRGGLIYDLRNQPLEELKEKQLDSLFDNWKRSRESLKINLDDQPMTLAQIRKYILVQMITELRTRLSEYHNGKSSGYVCRGKSI